MIDTSVLIGGYIATMVLSGIGYWLLYFKWRLNVPRYFFFIHFFIVNWSALMYLNKLFQTPLDRFALELDWIVSTPLIVLALTLSACYKALHTSKDLVAAAMGLQAIVIVTGLLGAIAEPNQAALQTFFWAGCIAMVVLFVLLLGPIARVARTTSATLAAKYRILNYFIITLWVLYPLFWILHKQQYMHDVTYIIVFTILPIMCKAVFGFLDLTLLNQVGVTERSQ